MLERLRRAHEAIVAAGDDEVPHVVCAQIAAVLGSDAASVCTQQGDGLVARAVTGQPIVAAGDAISAVGTLAGLVLRTGEPVLCTDAREDPRTDPRRSAEVGMLSSVIAPLRLGGEVIGLLEASSPLPGRFDEVDLWLLDLLAGLAATRLERVLEGEAQRASRQAVEDRERLMETVFDSLQQGVWVLDAAGLLMMANPSADRLLGVAPGALIDRGVLTGWGRLLSEDGRPLTGVGAFMQGALAAGTAEHNQVVGIDSGGLVRWIQLSAAPVRERSGSLARAVITFTEVTRRRDRERALEISEARLRAAGELTGLGWWEHDMRTGADTWNSQLYTMVGRDPSLPAPDVDEWVEMVHPDDRAAMHSSAVRAPGEFGTRSVVVRARTSSGEYRVVKLWNSIQLVGGEPATTFGTVLDVTEQVELGRALSESEHRLADAEGLLAVGFWKWDLATGSLTWSEGMYHLVGLPVGEPVDTERWRALQHTDDRGSNDDLERRAVKEGIGFHHVFRLVRPDGIVRYLQEWTDAIRDDTGTVVGLRGATLDVTDREAAARSVAASERQLRAAFDEAPIGMSMIDMRAAGRGRLIRVNSAFARMLGRTIEELLTMGVAEWTFPADVVRDTARFQKMASGEEQATSYEKRFLHSDGHAVYAWLTSSRVLDDAGDPLYLVSHILDITEQRAQRAELSRLALTDGLTGLANRTLLDDRVRHALGQLARRPGALVGMLLLDVDRFKLVNDSLGHQVGDALLVEVARRLSAVCRRGSTVARQGGDEFVVLVDQATSLEDVELVAARVCEALRAPYVLPTGDTVVSTASIGIAITADHLCTPDDLVREADLALYHAKDTGRDRVVVFDSTLRARAMARVDVESKLRRGLDGDGLRVYLQPIVDLATGAVTGSEALVRLVDADGGLVLPGEFIEVAEDSGLITRVDSWVMARVVERLAAHPHLGRIAVNVSGRTLEQPLFVRHLEQALGSSGVDSGRLAIELTESVLMFGNPAVKEATRRIGQLGVALGIDDFGTGYSALAYLQAFELDFLKVDRSFVARLGSEPRAEVVVTAIVDLAHAHSMTVIAEGVETAQQAQILTALRCDAGQGWFFGRPAPSKRPT